MRYAGSPDAWCDLARLLKSSITVMSVRATAWRLSEETRRTRWQAAVSVAASSVRSSVERTRSESSSTVRLCFRAMSEKERSGEERSERREGANGRRGRGAEGEEEEDEDEEDSTRRAAEDAEEDGEGEEDGRALDGERPMAGEGVVAA